MSFLHGTEVDDVASKLVVISQVNGGTVVSIGVSPVGPVGLTQVNTPVDAEQFGPSVFDGRTIPHSLDAHFAQGAGSLFVINCFKNAHLAAIAAEAVVVPQGLIVPLAKVPVGPLVVSTTGEGPVTLVAGTDYTHNEADKFFTILNKTTYPKTTALHVAYSWFDPTLVQPADIIGGVDGGSGARTGIELLDEIYPLYNITPKIIIAPIYIEQPTVLNAILPKKDALRARVIVDAPNGTTVAGAITARGDGGAYANFDISDKRVIGVYPYVLKPDPLSPNIAGRAFPLSPYYAGVWAASVAANGIARSPSNLPIKGISKAVTTISCGLNAADTDANNLNAAGISTIYTAYGQGMKIWGNRNFSFPVNQNIDSFSGVQLVQDVLDESVQIAAINFQDLPLNLALIDTILSSVNGFINTLIKSGALLDGSATYDPAKNTPVLLAQGKLTIDVSYLPPPAAEDIVFQSYIDISLFSTINS